MGTRLQGALRKALDSGRNFKPLPTDRKLGPGRAASGSATPRPTWTFHFTPTSGSWLNAVESFFSAMTRRRLKRGVFHSLVGFTRFCGHCYAADAADWNAAAFCSGVR